MQSSHGLKKTPINASFFPNENEREDEHFENLDHSPTTTAPASEAGFSGGEKTADVKSKKKIILVQFEENDPENPMNWSTGRKWTITILLNLMTLIIGLSTSAYSSGITSMSEEFGVATVVGQVGMFTFNAACAIAPLFVAPLCELTGRRYIYLGAFLCFTLVDLMLALGKNIGTEIVGRLLSGLFGSIGTILVGGTFADMFVPRDRSVPMSVFTFAAIFSTIAAPLYCGFIDQSLGWRWIQWIHMIAAGVLLIAEFIFLKESRGAVILKARAASLRKETGDDRYRAPIELESDSIAQLFRESSLRAIQLLYKEPVVFLFGFWIALAWGVVFLFLSAIPLAFAGNRGWNTGIAGLPYLGLIVGCFIGFATGFWQDSMYYKAMDNNNGVPVPEARLYGAMVFGPLFPIGIIMFSFTQYGFVHWIAPIIALVLIILGIYHIFLAVYNYTSDSYAEYSSSAIAGQGFMRNMFAASFPLFATQMFKGMGYQWAGLMIACIGFCLVPLPFVLFKYGASIRAKSKFAASNTGLSADEDEQGAPNGKKLNGRATYDDEKENKQIEAQMSSQTDTNQDLQSAGFGDQAAQRV
ncbi:Synaptic vesicle transporter SVOP and related transporters (major facilitator superfamily) [Phaffia rhodozyma]|uniref:Synaptic vesicle transporter SVOP and related transporters (Major facilitator superfamily) n=1 Tax=Phaffia rhodozyma TaxID=264483 RepID=A0A0F7SPV3_PHARH|nr:Synaptic vesicle transporter SVOP and related transporters (major facilitator superfamily) [Phaffia rhodozyma]